MLKNQKGFTLIEMLIVLLIISVLLMVTIPNVTKHFASIDEKGCDAFVAMVQGQVEAYKIETNEYPTLEDLVKEGYLNDNNEEEEIKCPNGQSITIDGSGKVSEDGSGEGAGDASNE